MRKFSVEIKYDAWGGIPYKINWQEIISNQYNRSEQVSITNKKKSLLSWKSYESEKKNQYLKKKKTSLQEKSTQHTQKKLLKD